MILPPAPTRLLVPQFLGQLCRAVTARKAGHTSNEDPLSASNPIHVFF